MFIIYIQTLIILLDNKYNHRKEFYIMENNKTFEMPKAEVIVFENEDVIVTSGVEMPEMPA